MRLPKSLHMADLWPPLTSAAARGSARPIIIRRGISRRGEIGWWWWIIRGRAVVEGWRSGERSERRADDHRGGANDRAHHAERPEQRNRRAGRRIILRLGG